MVPEDFKVQSSSSGLLCLLHIMCYYSLNIHVTISVRHEEVIGSSDNGYHERYET